jgi:hypothetical protein
MDGSRFDEIARNLARGTTRRGLVAGLVGIAAGIGAGRRGAAQVSQAQCGNMFCKDNPGVCKPGCVCCVYPNGNSRCRPPGTCSPGWETCPADRPFIDPVRGCVQCLDASQCPAPSGQCQVATCTAGVCGSAPGMAGTECRAATDLCDVAEACDGSTSACPADAFAPNSVVCRTAACTDGVATLAENCSGTGAACPPLRTQSCAPYHCAGTGCASGCTDDTGCVDGYHCDSGQCLLDAGLGTLCDENSDCESGFCVDGVCCNSPCAGLCDTCAGATPGICATSTCDAPGTCQVGPGTCNAQTGACEYSPAQDEASCGTGDQICCGGICCDPGETCVGGVCQVACSDLGEACAGNDDCCGTGICDNGTCLPCRALAEVCSGDEFCCNDGVTLCEGGQCCHPLAESCAFNAECCSFRCQDGSCCQRPGGECSDDGECCYGLLGACRQGTCACQLAGDPCQQNDDCCDELSCLNGVCRPEVCQDLQGQCVDDTDCCADAAVCGSFGCCSERNGPCTEQLDCCGSDSACLQSRCQACIEEEQICNPVAESGCCPDFECRFDDRDYLPGGKRWRCLPQFCLVTQEECGPGGLECCDGAVCTGPSPFPPLQSCCQPEGGACREPLGTIPGFGDCCPGLSCNSARQCAPCRQRGESCDGDDFNNNCCFVFGATDFCRGGVCVARPG